MHGCLDAVELGLVYGWAWNPQAPDQPVSVDIQLDGVSIGSCVANIFRPDLRDAGIGDGRHAFQFRLPASLLDNKVHTVSAHIPSLGVPIGPAQQAFLADEARRAVPGMAVRERPKPHYLTICAIVRNEGPYLLEWIAYHRAVGVDHFLIFDNESTDGSLRMLSSLRAAGIIDLLPWPSAAFPENRQAAAYMGAMFRLRDVTEWIAFIDLDEFLVPREASSLPEFLRLYPDVPALGVGWRLFGSSGAESREPGLVMDRFRRCAPPAHPINRHVKSIVRADYLKRPIIHLHHLVDGVTVDEHRRAIPLGRGGQHPEASTDLIQVNHYMTKSRAEWDAKRRRGRADLALDMPARVRSDREFELHDRNEVEDAAILRFRPAVLEEMGRLEKLIAANAGAAIEAWREKPTLPLPPEELVQLVGGSDNYLAVGRSIRDVLVQQGGLLPTDRVLEIGCGVGRIAHALSEYMDAAGRYDGVEIHKPHVDWCATHITPAYPNFRFHHADIRNAAYNPGGAVSAAGYRLPFADGAFDFVFLASVFTHMREADIRAYLTEIRRVLTPGGRLMATFFLLNDESRTALEAGTPRLELPYRTDRFWAHSEACPEVAIAFRHDIVMAMLEEAGLTVDRMAPGDWVPRTDESLSYQDIIFARRP